MEQTDSSDRSSSSPGNERQRNLFLGCVKIFCRVFPFTYLLSYLGPKLHIPSQNNMGEKCFNIEPFIVEVLVLIWLCAAEP